MNNDGLFLVTIKVELDDGTSRESVYRVHQDNIHNLKFGNGIERMYDELLEPNPLIETELSKCSSCGEKNLAYLLHYDGRCDTCKNDK